jgi:DNA-binding transcriptional ArsR family regulator
VTDGPIRGRAGIAYAAALLCAPDDPPSMRSVAASVGMSPQSVSNAATQLLEAGLLEADRRPIVPELFWALAAVWRSGHEVAVASVPEGGDWVLGGDGAAAALGAPVVHLDDRPTLLTADTVTLRRAERRLGRASNDGERAATIALAPTPLVVTTATPHDPWPLPHPVFAALDLARDRGRGREILDGWTPEGATVVWR